MKRLPVLPLALLCVLTGCQSAVHEGSDSPVSQAAFEQGAVGSTPKPIGIDDDSSPRKPNPFADAMLAPVQGLGQVAQQIVDLPVRGYQYANGDTPKRAALMLQDRSSADNRRAGINRLVGFEYAHRPPYTTAYKIMAQEDDDPTVRAAALRACNIARDRSATPVFIQALSDRRGDSRGEQAGSEIVRLEAAKGLANLPDPNAAGPLVKLVSDPTESRDVRIAAVDALKYYRTAEVARALSGLVNDRDFSVGWQARRSLVYMTSRDFRYDEGAWLGYFSGPGARWDARADAASDARP
jgi:hypothetical protein